MNAIGNALKSRTIWFSILLAGLGVIEASLNILQPLMSSNTFALFSVGVGAVVAMMRAVTKEPLSAKSDGNNAGEANSTQA